MKPALAFPNLEAVDSAAYKQHGGYWETHIYENYPGGLCVARVYGSSEEEAVANARRLVKGWNSLEAHK